MNLDREDLYFWRRVRRYDVPPVMVEECTAARLAGDWASACVLAGFKPDVDLAEVRTRFGAVAADRIAAELSGLAPDLLRWHFPQHRTYAVTSVDVVLEPSASAETPVIILRVRHGQPMAVVVDDRPAGSSISLPPWLWHAGHTHRLRAAAGGNAARLPGFTAGGEPIGRDGWGGTGDEPSLVERSWLHRERGEVREAWRLAGIDLDRDIVLGDWPWGRRQAQQALEGQDPFAIARELRRLAELGHGEAAVRLAHRNHVHLTTGRHLRGRMVVDDYRCERLAEVSSVTQHPAADLGLVWSGFIPAGALHPLVREALFPGTAPAPARLAADVVRVRCAGTWHRIGYEAGSLRALDHAPGEVTGGCADTVRAWTSATGRLPKLLRFERRDLFGLMWHGDTRTVIDLLNAGMDPGVCDGNGRNLLHHLPRYDHAVLLPRLLAAGLDVNARDRMGRTPLHLATLYGGNDDLVAALLGAGADPSLRDQDGRPAVGTPPRPPAAGPAARPRSTLARIAASLGLRH